jgi:CheY-like chemotaxis protein
MVIESIKRYNWKGRTALVIEEDPSGLAFLKEILGYTGMEILDTGSGEDAVFLVKKHRNIDIVLIETAISTSDGYDVIRRIKSQRKDIPVLVVSTHTLPEDREQSFEAGCDAFVTKPIDTFELLWNIDRLLGEDLPELNQPGKYRSQKDKTRTGRRDA